MKPSGGYKLVQLYSNFSPIDAYISGDGEYAGETGKSGLAVPASETFYGRLNRLGYETVVVGHS